VKGNSKFFAVAVRGGGGPVLVLPYTATGKLPRGYPLVNGHSAPVYDMAWSPFNDNILATGSDDATCKIWSIPDGGLTETIRDPVQTLTGHGKPVSLLNWHPTASNVIATVGKEPSVKIWDVEKGVAPITLTGFEGLVQDFGFNSNGSLLVTSDKGKSAKIHDPRSGAVVSEWKPHGGGKPFRLVWLGSTGNICTVGFTAQSKREFKVWDTKNLDKPLATQELDQAAGVIMPFYDEDTKMLYLSGKGDGNIRYFEMVDAEPYVYPLAEHRTNVSTKGADMLPKRALNPLRCEVARFLKLTTDSVEPMSFIVPRKEVNFQVRWGWGGGGVCVSRLSLACSAFPLTFSHPLPLPPFPLPPQEDIFPDTYAGVPCMTADDWFAGKNVAGPKRMPMDPAKRPGFVPAAAAFVAAAAPAPAPAPAPKPAAAAAGPSGSPTPADDGALAAALERAAKAEAQVAALSSQVATLKLSAGAGGSGDAALKAELEDARSRIATLEASEAKLKKALAVMSA
jgi:coronin-1B/1C/6